MHWVQYGLRRSHFVFRFRHVKQSSVAPVTGALLLLFLGTVGWVGSWVVGSWIWVVELDIVVEIVMKDIVGTCQWNRVHATIKMDNKDKW
jgi:hypothetical protein